MSGATHVLQFVADKIGNALPTRKKWTLRSPFAGKPFFSKRGLVILGMFVPVFLMLLVGALQWKSYSDASRSRDLVTRTRNELLNLESLFSRVKDAETAQRGYLLTHQQAYLQPYVASLTAVPKQLNSLRELAGDDPDGLKNIALLETVIRARYDEIARTIGAEQQNNHAGALKIVNTGAGRATMDRLSETIRGMQTIAVSELKYREEIYKRNSYITTGLSVVLVLLGISFMVAIACLILRMEKMQDMITICAWSKLIDYEGEWLTVEQYLSRRLNAKVTHGISRDEAQKMLKLLEQEKLRAEL